MSGLVQNMLLQSGAFEIYVGNSLEYSKLKTQMMPTPADITRILVKYGVKVKDIDRKLPLVDDGSG